MRTGMLAIVWLIVGALMLCSTESEAQAVWTNGTITRAPWETEYIHVEVNNVHYRFLNKSIRIARHYEVKPGMYNEQKLSLENLTIGKSVMIRAQGHRIYEIRVID